MAAVKRSRFIALRHVGVAQDELLRALADGDLTAEGRLSVRSRKWAPIDGFLSGKGLFREVFVPTGPLNARAPVGREWWQAVGIEVELQTPGWVLFRDLGAQVQCVLQTKVKTTDVERLWPGDNYYDADASADRVAPDVEKDVPSGALARFLKAEADGEKTLPQLRELAAAHFRGNKITDRAWRAAVKQLDSGKKRQRGQRRHIGRANTAP
jgi:hypothetical protein